MEKRIAKRDRRPFSLRFASDEERRHIAERHLGKFEARVLPCIAREDAPFNRKHSYIKDKLEHLVRDGEDADPGKPHGNKTEKYVARRIIMRSLVYHSARGKIKLV